MSTPMPPDDGDGDGAPRLRRHRADRDPGGDGAVLPRLRHVGHHVPRPARRARRPQAGAPPDPLGHGGAGLPARPPLREVRPRHRRRHGQVPPARRRARSTTPSCAWPSPSRCATRSSTSTATSARPTSARRPSATPSAACPRSPCRCSPTSTRTPSTSSRPTTASSRGARRPAGPLPEPAGQRQPGHRGRHGHQHPAPQPGRGHRRHRPPDRQPRGHARRPHAVRARARLPDRRAHHGPGRDHGRLPHRPGLREDAGQGRDRGDGKRGGGMQIVVTELPYQVSRNGHRRRIQELVDAGELEGIADVNDESAGGKTNLIISLQAGRQRQRRAEQPVQAHAAADQLRRQHGGAGRRRAPHAQPRPGAARATSTTRSRSSPAVRSSAWTRPAGTGPHRRGPAQGPRRDRRDHRPDPRQRGPGRGPQWPHGSASSSPRSRPSTSSTCASAS